MSDVSFVEAVLEWGRRTRRDLPWRRTRDPWAVLVAETMLQQTGVARVVPRYLAFLDAVPTAAACAAASPAWIVRCWDGLGYNRRAVLLHRAATAIVADHAGRVPDDLDALLALPGVGLYTARAVLAFAFERDHGVVDTNAARVAARAVAGEPLDRRRVQAIADALVPPRRAWEWNQSVLDLGATVCTRRAPRCGVCPAIDHCAWAATGWAAPDPAAGSAGSSVRQLPFAGSDRQGRGRLVAALRGGPLRLEDVADAAGWPHEPDRARRICEGLVADGLAEVTDGMLALPS